MTTTIGSGEVDGKSWQATASIGPWGWCYSVGGGTDCTAVAAHGKLAGQQVSMLTCAPSMGGAPASGIVFVASDVTRLMLRFSDGSSASFRAVKVAGSRVVGYAVPARVRVTSSREYGGRGQLVGSALGEAVGSEHTPGWIC